MSSVININLSTFNVIFDYAIDYYFSFALLIYLLLSLHGINFVYVYSKLIIAKSFNLSWTFHIQMSIKITLNDLFLYFNYKTHFIIHFGWHSLSLKLKFLFKCDTFEIISLKILVINYNFVIYRYIFDFYRI